MHWIAAAFFRSGSLRAASGSESRLRAGVRLGTRRSGERGSMGAASGSAPRHCARQLREDGDDRRAPPIIEKGRREGRVPAACRVGPAQTERGDARAEGRAGPAGRKREGGKGFSLFLFQAKF